MTTRRAHLAGLGTTAALALTALPTATRAATAGTNASAVVDWNSTMTAVVVTDAGKANAEAFCWFAFTHAAIYNAVVGITGRYQPYKWVPGATTDASPQAAVAGAANRILLTYFGHLPAARARIADTYAATLSKVPDGAAKQAGIRFGELAADRIIAVRLDDGRAGSLRFDMPLAAGVWRPTPTANAPFFSPWLGQVRPMLLTPYGDPLDWGTYNADPRAWGAPRNPDGTIRGAAPAWPALFRPAGPPALTSTRYAAEFNEVKAIGSKTSSVRTPAQTETALFISGISFAPIQAALRDLVTRRGLDISDSARLFAAADLSIADSIGIAWESKYAYGFWRPITAIRMAAEDGNSATEADPAWEPLLATPAYPDYISGLCSVTGAASRALTRVLGTDRIDIYITSPATNTTRNYPTAAALCQEAIDARIWGGIHFRTADVDADTTSARIADWALDHYFLPT